MQAAAEMLERHAGRSRRDRFVLYVVLPPAGRQVHAAGLPRARVRDQRCGRHHGLLPREAGRRPPADDGGRALFVRRSRVSGGVRSRDVHAGQPRVRLRSHAGEDRRDARGDARRNVCRRADGANRDVRAHVDDRARRAGLARHANRPAPTAYRIPNNAGGVGDASGVIMLDNIINRERLSLHRHRTNAPSRDSRALVETVDEEARPCRSLRCSPPDIGEVDLRDIDVYRARGGYEQWERAVREMQPAEVLDIGRKVGLARPRRRRFSDRPQVVVPSRQRQARALSRLQLRRGGARHVQRPHAARRRPHLVLEGILLGAYGIACAPRVHLHSRRVQARLRDLLGRARGSARGRATSARTSSARATISKSPCIAAPARTSAAKRPDCSTRSKASAASRVSSRRSRRSPVCTACRRW